MQDIGGNNHVGAAAISNNLYTLLGKINVQSQQISQLITTNANMSTQITQLNAQIVALNQSLARANESTERAHKHIDDTITKIDNVKRELHNEVIDLHTNLTVNNTKLDSLTHEMVNVGTKLGQVIMFIPSFVRKTNHYFVAMLSNLHFDIVDGTNLLEGLDELH